MRLSARKTFELRRLALAGGWAALVAALLLLPTKAMPDTAPWLPQDLLSWIEWSAHLGLFFVLAVLLARSLYRARSSARWLLQAVALLYALLLEVLQILVPGRGFEFADLVAAALGVACAEIVVRSRSTPNK